jgi:hypothetical protein
MGGMVDLSMPIPMAQRSEGGMDDWEDIHTHILLTS